MAKEDKIAKTILIMQISSISLIWMFVFGITWWILRLLITSIMVIPIFITLASILTYVFVGLQRNRNEKEVKSGGNK